MATASYCVDMPRVIPCLTAIFSNLVSQKSATDRQMRLAEQLARVVSSFKASVPTRYKKAVDDFLFVMADKHDIGEVEDAEEEKKADVGGHSYLACVHR